MNKVKFFSLILLVPTLLCAADITGLEAEQRYHAMATQERGPFCTGACLPGQPCDPTCTTIREENGWRCSQIRHTRSGQIEYQCNNLR